MSRFFSILLFTALASAAPFDDDARVEELYNQAKSAQSQGDIAGAIHKYEEILHIAPQLGPAYNNLGALYFRQRDYQKAALVLEQGLKVNPGMPSASALLGISLFEMGRYDQARPKLEAALKANPHDTNAHLFLAKDLTQLGKFNDAATQLQQLASSQPKNQEVWYLLSKVYMKLSEQSLAAMNAIDPDSVLAHELSAEVMEAMNNHDGAVVELKKAIAIAPQHTGTHYKLGEVYFNLTQLDSAAEQYQAELALDPHNCFAQWKLGSVTILNNGDSQAALTGIDNALSMCPGLSGARLDRARALIKLNRSQEALHDLEVSAKADPAEPTTHFLLSKALRALGRTSEAQGEMQTFKTLDDAARARTAERAQEVIKNKETAH